MRRVLVIEDDTAIRLLYRINLTLEGFDVCEADTGGDGWLLARSEGPDVILLDLRLPDCHGSEVLELLRGDHLTADVPVLVISATADKETREELLAGGASGFITKPFNPAKLGPIVRELLEKRETELSEQARDALVRGPEVPATGLRAAANG
jgi:DNA-binding response OmpR family regulator